MFAALMLGRLRAAFITVWSSFEGCRLLHRYRVLCVQIPIVSPGARFRRQATANQEKHRSLPAARGHQYRRPRGFIFVYVTDLMPSTNSYRRDGR
jgi:hypothetical protein